MKYRILLALVSLTGTTNLKSQVPSLSEQRIQSSISRNNRETESRISDMQHNQSLKDINHSMTVSRLHEEQNLSAPGAMNRLNEQRNQRTMLNMQHNEELKSSRQAIQEVQRRGAIDSEMLNNQLRTEQAISANNRNAQRNQQAAASAESAARNREFLQSSGGDYNREIDNNDEALVNETRLQRGVADHVPQTAIDESKIAEFLIKQVDSGSVYAAYDLSKRYVSGNGVQKDIIASARYRFIACDRGNIEAQEEVNALIGKYTLPTKNPQATQAENDFNQYLYAQLKNGSGDAAIALAMNVKNGTGFVPNLIESKKLLEIAARFGNPLSLELLQNN